MGSVQASKPHTTPTGWRQIVAFHANIVSGRPAGLVKEELNYFVLNSKKCDASLRGRASHQYPFNKTNGCH